MTCRDFQMQIKSFVTGDIEDDQLEEFINHVKVCNDCYDELEIYYMLQVGLDEIDRDAGTSYDFKGKLKSIIRACEERLYRDYKIKVYKSLLFITANIMTAAVFILQMLLWLKIL